MSYSPQQPNIHDKHFEAAAIRIVGNSGTYSTCFIYLMVHASSAHTKLDVYRQRKAQDSAYYRCVEDCFETFEQVYQERFEQKFSQLQG
ncbi:MAG: hypothetical protein GY850_19565 [bacterium]|nr:hypothetical protein [bacterium]